LRIRTTPWTVQLPAPQLHRLLSMPLRPRLATTHFTCKGSVCEETCRARAKRGQVQSTHQPPHTANHTCVCAIFELKNWRQRHFGNSSVLACAPVQASKLPCPADVCVGGCKCAQTPTFSATVLTTTRSGCDAATDARAHTRPRSLRFTRPAKSANSCLHFSPPRRRLFRSTGHLSHHPSLPSLTSSLPPSFPPHFSLHPLLPPLRRENTIAQISSAVGCLGSAMWDFLTLLISLLPKLGARAVNLLALVAMVFVALYLFLSRGFGDYLVLATQMAVIGFIFPNSSAVVKEI
jgi:hypothetical protein